jgi:hypothetical protein
MTATLLAIFLLAATVDPRLAESLFLLGGVQVVLHNTLGEPLGKTLANRARSPLVTIVVEPVDSGFFAHYNRTTRTITVSEALAAEDPRVIASALAHELQHSLDIDMALFGVVPGDCLTVETRGFATQAVVAAWAIIGSESSAASARSSSRSRFCPCPAVICAHLGSSARRSAWLAWTAATLTWPAWPMLTFGGGRWRRVWSVLSDRTIILWLRSINGMSRSPIRSTCSVIRNPFTRPSWWPLDSLNAACRPTVPKNSCSSMAPGCPPTR